MSTRLRVKPVVRKRAGISPAVKAKALQLYLFSNKTLVQCAQAAGIPVATLKTWYNTEKWPAQRRQLEADLQEQIGLERARFIRRELMKVMEDQLDLGRDFEAQVKKFLKTFDGNATMDAEELEKVGKALQSGSTLTARAVGLDNKATFKALENLNVNVLVNPNLTATPVDPSQLHAIEVECSEPIPAEDPQPPAAATRGPRLPLPDA